ncbi:MAG: alpha/beta fold hydrolase [Candidatus Eremiobacteraeota bacterium]|nr:alpha/beta fold hydrolase [Candidatus Eremiobacteraeota bacterium]
MQRYLARDGAVLSYGDAGGAGSPALLFVHGWQGDRSIWDAIVARLREKFRCIAVDLRGFGASSSARGPYTLEQHSEDLRGLVEFLRLGRAVVIGHSMGGKIAVRFAVDAESLVEALVLVAPVPLGPAGFSEKGVAYLRATAGNAPAARAWLTKTIMAPPSAEVLDRLCTVASRASSAAVEQSLDSWVETDLSDEAKRLTEPALVIGFQHDAPERVRDKAAALLPNARFEEVQDCAHYAVLEQPLPVAQLIEAFVSRLEGTQQRREV